MTARVSVICAFYNGAEYIAEAIESVLAQDYADFELILVDDGSTDSSTEIAKDYASRFANVRYVEHPNHANVGASPSRNVAWRHARGDYVAIIDCDDVWRPGKLLQQVRLLDSDPAVGMVCGMVNYWSSWSGGKDRLVPTGAKRDARSEPLETILQTYPLGTAHAPCPSDVLIRRSILGDSPFEEEFVGPRQIYEDQAFFMKVYFAAPVHFASEVWLDYRIHPDSCVSTVVRDGHYERIRREFLDWLEGFTSGADLEGKERVQRAISNARWDLDHPLVGRIKRRLRRALS